MYQYLNDKPATQADKYNAADTSHIFGDLVKQYRAQHKPVLVDFRKLSPPSHSGNRLIHNIHPYPARLLPQIPNFFLRCASLCPKESTVLDPFSGSGTVALEASLQGHQPLIADANPFALLLSSVKTTPYDPEELAANLARIISWTPEPEEISPASILNSHLWYSGTKKRELDDLNHKILTRCSPRDLPFFQICFSAVARELSNADPSISVPVRLKQKEAFSSARNTNIRARQQWIESTTAHAVFSKVCEKNIFRVKSTNMLLPKRLKARVVGTDARALSAAPDVSTGNRSSDHSIPIAITSPPYGSAQKYIRATSLSLNWLDLAKPHDLSLLESQTIGREHLPRRFNKKELGLLPPHFQKLINAIAEVNAHRAAITHHYLNDFRDALNELDRVLSRDGTLILILGNNVVTGRTLYNDTFAIETMQDLGWHVHVRLTDKIKSRALITRRKNKAPTITREQIIIFQRN